MRILIGLLLALAAIGAYAQTTTVGATLRFTAPTQRTDNSQITGTLSYIALAGPKGGTKTRLATPVVPAGTTLSNQPPGTCYQVIAAENGLESAPSNEACLAQPPNGATGLTVTIVITVTP